jgi:hypothetical protein
LLEPEPVEQQLFGRAGAKVFWPGSGAGYINSYKMLQNPLIFHTKVEVDFKNHKFVAIYFKEPLMIIYVFKKHEHFLKNM